MDVDRKIECALDHVTNQIHLTQRTIGAEGIIRYSSIMLGDGATSSTSPFGMLCT
jgi:hypothetical protein